MRHAGAMPEVVVKFGRETGEINIEVDPQQFKDPDELRAWAANIQHHIFSRMLLPTQERLDAREAAGKVSEVVRTLVIHQVMAKELNLQEGQWRYVGT